MTAAICGCRPEIAGLQIEGLTPALRRILEFIAGGEERGRMIVQIVATGGRSVSQLDALRSAGYVEYYYAPEGGPDRIRITAAGRDAFPHQASLRYRRDDDRYLVYLGDDRIGFVRYAPDKRRWKAIDTTNVVLRWFDTRDAAGKALHRRFMKMMRDRLL